MDQCKAQLGQIKGMLLTSSKPGDYFYDLVRGKRRRVPAFEFDGGGQIIKIHPKVKFYRA